MSQGIYTIVANCATVFVVYHFSRSLVDKLWHSVVDGLGDGSGYLRSELAILHHLTSFHVSCQIDFTARGLPTNVAKPTIIHFGTVLTHEIVQLFMSQFNADTFNHLL